MRSRRGLPEDATKTWWNAWSASLVTAQQPSSFGREQLEQMMAPIALYPDALMSQVLMAATYPADVAERFADFLDGDGIEVLALSCRGIITAAEVGTLGRDDVLGFVAANDHPDAEAVLVPDTALHTVAWLDDLEERLGKPVLTANQVSVWEGLRIAGDRTLRTGPGTLFRTEAV